MTNSGTADTDGVRLFRQLRQSIIAKPGGSGDIEVSNAKPGTVIGIMAVDEAVYAVRSGSILTKDSVSTLAGGRDTPAQKIQTQCPLFLRYSLGWKLPTEAARTEGALTLRVPQDTLALWYSRTRSMYLTVKIVTLKGTTSVLEGT